jgi:hypothetical protein
VREIAEQRKADGAQDAQGLLYPLSYEGVWGITALSIPVTPAIINLFALTRYVLPSGGDPL